MNDFINNACNLENNNIDIENLIPDDRLKYLRKNPTIEVFAGKIAKKLAQKNKENLPDIIHNILTSEITSSKMLKILEQRGIPTTSITYFSALAYSVILKGIEKSDINVLTKLLELCNNTTNNNSINQSHNNLLNAINNVRNRQDENEFKAP